LKGDDGEPFRNPFGYQPGYQQWTYQQQAQRQQEYAKRAYQYQQYQQRKQGAFIFKGITKEDGEYLFTIWVENVRFIEIYGKNGLVIGIYRTRDRYGDVQLRVSLEDAKIAGYEFTIRLYDDDNWAEKTYRIKRPLKWWQKVLKFMKIKNY
jgi:hypothetical protein